MAETETGWLLEKMHAGNVHYISADYVLQWTDDPNKALRLARREDAEALCTIVEDCEKIAGHEWPGDSPSDAEQLIQLRKACKAALPYVREVLAYTRSRQREVCAQRTIQQLQNAIGGRPNEKAINRRNVSMERDSGIQGMDTNGESDTDNRHSTSDDVGSSKEGGSIP